MTKDEWREEMMQDAYEKKVFQAKVLLLHEEPESIQNWTEWQKFSESCAAFKEFCTAYDLDFKEEIEATIQGV